jgi:hypothetical protein
VQRVSIEDSVTYMWENKRFKIENKTLVKVTRSMKAEAAKYSQRTGRENESVLVVDTREIDELVAVLTCVAILRHNDSFSKS